MSGRPIMTCYPCAAADRTKGGTVDARAATNSLSLSEGVRFRFGGEQGGRG